MSLLGHGVEEGDVNLRRSLARERRSQIASRLATGAASTPDLAAVVGSITTRELLSLLRTMRQQGLAAREGELWSTTGAPKKPRRKRRPHSRSCPDYPLVTHSVAVQIGIERDPLVAALFGAKKKK